MEEQGMYEIYERYVQSQLLWYRRSLEIINQAIQRLKTEGSIQKNVELTGRIKSYLSVQEIESENKKIESGTTKEQGQKKLKKIDDCFGIRVAANQQDLDTITETIQQLFSVVQNKEKDESDRGYKALHQMVHLDLDKVGLTADLPVQENIPLIEIQYWTKELAKRCLTGDQSYSEYKKKKNADTIRKMEKPELLRDIPIAYRANGRGELELLSVEEVIKGMYPDLEGDRE